MRGERPSLSPGGEPSCRKRPRPPGGAARRGGELRLGARGRLAVPLLAGGVPLRPGEEVEGVVLPSAPPGEGSHPHRGPDGRGVARPRRGESLELRVRRLGVPRPLPRRRRGEGEARRELGAERLADLVDERDGERVLLRENESIYLPLGCVHRMENPGMIPLTLIEVQSGSYLGEDDIVRIEDTYGRV